VRDYQSLTLPHWFSGSAQVADLADGAERESPDTEAGDGGVGTRARHRGSVFVSSEESMPGSTITLISLAVMSFGGTIISARGAFASREKLMSMATQIGTNNPVVARIACFIGLFVCTATGLGAIALLIALIRARQR
jgi:hypothetical protein